MRNYIKKKTDSANLLTDELIEKIALESKKSYRMGLKLFLALCLILPLGVAVSILKTSSNEEANMIVPLASAPLASTSTKKDLISIPSGVVKANPFVPYRNIDGDSSVGDVPKFDLIAPPEFLNEGSDAARVMDTVVSGILFDKHSPSAIINIEGNDYLVKKGDVVNNYKVMNITQDSVTIKLGNNTYKAGIGEILTEGSVNYNDVSNLNKKFGGEKR